MALDIKKIHEIMLKEGLNQSEVASKAKMQTSTLSKILNGKTKKSNMKTIHNIAKGLGVNPKEILKGDD